MMFLSLFFIVNFLIFFNLDFFSKLININDSPDKKLKLHKNKTPLVGGIIVFFNLLIAVVWQSFFSDNFFMLEKIFFSKRDVFSIIFLTLSFFLVGLYDDKYSIAPLNKLLFIILVSIIVLSINNDLIVSKLSFSFLKKKILLNNLSIFFTIFCIVILKNALNFYDGVNGQSGIYYLVVFLFLFFKSDYNFFYLTIIVSLTFVLLLNLNNKLFFGDNGVYLVSTLIIISLIYEYNITKNILYVDEIFLILILPGIDLVRLTIERLVFGKNPLFGDRNHLHHLLIKKFNLMITNIFLFILNIFPIVLFYLDVRFINICILFLTIYFVVFISLQKSQSSNI